MLGLFRLRLFLLSIAKYPAFVITGDDVRNDGLTFDMLCCRIAAGRHRGRAVVVDEANDSATGGIVPDDAERGGGGDDCC